MNIGTFYFSLKFHNEVKKSLGKAIRDGVKIVAEGEKEKQDEIKKTNTFALNYLQLLNNQNKNINQNSREVIKNNIKDGAQAVGKGEKKKQEEIKKTNTFWQNQNKNINQISRQVTNFTQSFASNMVMFGGIATVGAVALNKLVESTMNYAHEQLKAEAISGTSTKAIQNLSLAYSNLSNISLGQATSELAELSKRIENAKLGFENPQNLIIAGINFNANTSLNSAIQDLRKNLSGRSSQEISAFLERAGLSKDLIFMIKASSQELEQFNKIPILTQRQLQDIQKAGRSFDFVKKMIGGLIRMSQAEIAPYLRNELERIFKGIENNKKKIISFMNDTTKGITMFVRAIGRSISLVGDFASKLFKTDKGFQVIAGGLALLWLSAKPFRFMLASIIAILEDIQQWKLTGESPFAKLYEWTATAYSGLMEIPFAADTVKLALLAMASAVVITRLASLGGALTGILTTVGLLAKNPIIMGLIATVSIGKKFGKNFAEKRAEEYGLGKHYKSDLNQDTVRKLTTEHGTQEGFQVMENLSKNNTSKNINANQNITININGDNAPNIAESVQNILLQQTRQLNSFVL